jgi:hypothetical protein
VSALCAGSFPTALWMWDTLSQMKNVTAWVTFVFALYFQSSKLGGVKWQVFAGFFVGFRFGNGTRFNE